jgi:subtilisin family serine protease
VATPEPLPSYSLSVQDAGAIALASPWPVEVSREWAFEGSTGQGVRVCVLDSGIDGGHPDVGGVERSMAVEADDEGYAQVVEDDSGDAYGHGTACAGIIRSLAPGVTFTSVRVLGRDNRGSGGAMVAGLRWAVDEGFDVINMSLSTTNRELRAFLYEVADSAYFQRTLVVASAHNMQVKSWPWRFSSVISVGSHDDPDPMRFYYNPSPPVEFFARGMELDIAWLDGGRITASGNSFATAHMSGICALVLGKHPDLTPFQVKSVLHLTAGNVAGPRAA